ncbi:hypothetical protein DFS33DRAFT_1229565, partial [Desarmillaria ectypa]
RSGHGFTGEYYSRFVPNENIDYSCRERLQTREHILPEYEQYEEHRNLLREVWRDTFLPDILGAKDGIETLAAFLEKSGAFKKMGHPR